MNIYTYGVRLNTGVYNTYRVIAELERDAEAYISKVVDMDGYALLDIEEVFDSYLLDWGYNVKVSPEWQDLIDKACKK